jgi:hypothetical protein
MPFSVWARRPGALTMRPNTLSQPFQAPSGIRDRIVSRSLGSGAVLGWPIDPNIVRQRFEFCKFANTRGKNTCKRLNISLDDAILISISTTNEGDTMEDISELIEAISELIEAITALSNSAERELLTLEQEGFNA